MPGVDLAAIMSLERHAPVGLFVPCAVQSCVDAAASPTSSGGDSDFCVEDCKWHGASDPMRHILCACGRGGACTEYEEIGSALESEAPKPPEPKDTRDGRTPNPPSPPSSDDTRDGKPPARSKIARYRTSPPDWFRNLMNGY